MKVLKINYAKAEKFMGEPKMEGINKNSEYNGIKGSEINNLENVSTHEKEKYAKSLIGIYTTLDHEQEPDLMCLTVNPDWDGKKIPEKRGQGFIMDIYEDKQGSLFLLDGTPVTLDEAYKIASEKNPYIK